MLLNYFKIAWRNLLKSKGTSLINIAGLATGIAVVLIIGLWIQDELSYNKYYPTYDRFAQMFINQEGNDGNIYTGQAMSIPAVKYVQDNFKEDFEMVSLSTWNYQHLLAYEDLRLIKDGMQVEAVFPEMLQMNFIHGDRKTSLEDPYSIILNESLAKAIFGDENPIGKVVRFDTTHDMEVTGVFEDFPHNTSFRNAHFFVPWEYFVIANDWVPSSVDNWGNHSFQGFVLLKEGIEMEAASELIKDIEKERYDWGDPDLLLQAMSNFHLYSNYENGKIAGGRIQFVWMFGIIGAFVLILACINFMNLSTARSEKRAKEVGIRKTVGSGRGQLIGQFLTESILIALVSLFFGLLLIQLSIAGFNELADKRIEIPWLSPLFWSGLLGFTLFVGLLAGSYPAFFLSAFRPIRALRGVSIKKGISSLPRRILVTVQFTVSVALIIGTLVIFKQIQYAKDRPIGYERENTIYFFDNMELTTKFELMRADLLNTGLVEAVSHSNAPVTNVWSNNIGFDWEGKDPEETISFGTVGVSHEYGKSIGWEIIDGRDFDRAMQTDSLAMVLNESAVAITGMDAPVGKYIDFDDERYQIIGVVKDMMMESPWDPVKPTIFLYSNDWKSVYTVRFKETAGTESALAATKAIFDKHSPSSLFEYFFVDEEYQEKFDSEQRIGSLARVFAILAIFISCLGLLGLSAYVAEQKTKEIGIRRILGASVANLWAMQSKGFVTLVAISCLIAIPVAWYVLEGWLSDYEYRIKIGWQIFLVAAILSVVVTMATVSFQSLRAALTNPVNSLRNE
ncbi:MAG: ABC transporter permease [Bacteroidota bacterium]